MTVNGPIAAEQIGFTLIHEHVFLSILADYLDTNRGLDDPDSAYVELMHYRNSGGVTLVDQTNRGLEQQPSAVREIAKKQALISYWDVDGTENRSMIRAYIVAEQTL